MATYKYKLYQRPSDPAKASRIVDELAIEADDDASAISEAKRVRAPFEFEADSVALFDPVDIMIWHREAPVFEARA